MTILSENEYEDLLSLWADLESGLGIILRSPGSIQQFQQRVRQYDHWMSDLLKVDPDLGLYLLFQLAANSPVGYSASHALICAVLCHLMAQELELPVAERDSLVHAAMTMNMSMTDLQDKLADQIDKPNSLQQHTISRHPLDSSLMLTHIGVTDELWLEAVNLHHDENTSNGDLHAVPAAQRLGRILRAVDRYAAMISPRKSREGRSAAESLLSIITRSAQRQDEVGQGLVRAVGLYPPGTYLRLDTGELAVVLRHSTQSNQPQIAIVISEEGEVLHVPRLHNTSDGNPRIKVALPAASVHQRFSHHRVLQLPRS